MMLTGRRLAAALFRARSPVAAPRDDLLCQGGSPLFLLLPAFSENDMSRICVGLPLTRRYFRGTILLSGNDGVSNLVARCVAMPQIWCNEVGVAGRKSLLSRVAMLLIVAKTAPGSPPVILTQICWYLIRKDGSCVG